MITKRKFKNEDYTRIIKFLQQQYWLNKNEDCWLSQRFEDMEYRVGVMVVDRGGEDWHKGIWLWEEDGNVVAVMNSEGKKEAFMHIATGYEYLFNEMLDLAEQIYPNVVYKGDIEKRLSVIVLDKHKYRTAELAKREYVKEDDHSYLKKVKCDKINTINLPDGFEIINGSLEGNSKAYDVCHWGFHPETEGEISLEIPNNWKTREQAPMFDYKYQIMVKNKVNGDLCSYLYVWVDKDTRSAYVEPMSTREKYRKKGFGKAMLLYAQNLLFEDGIEYCFVNPFAAHRDRVYSSAGFETFDEEFVWTKKF